MGGVTAYHVPAHGAPIDLKLDANEGRPPSSGLFHRLIEAGPDLMRRYPDARALQALLAGRLDVDPARLIVTAGADDALDRLCRAVLCPGRELLLTNPSFEMLPRYARIMGAGVREVPWWEGAFPIEAMIEAIRPETSLVAVVSPNNPTGLAAPFEVVRRLSLAAPGAIVLLDHAYVEFAHADHTREALALPNVVVVRTLSKAWGLAGLRVGYAVGSGEVMDWCRAAGGPYAVARPSIALAMARLKEDQEPMTNFVDQVRADRCKVHATLDGLGVHHSASEANFAFVTDRRAAWIRDAFAGLGIAIRGYPGHPELGDSLRITMPGDSAEAARVCHALRAALSPESRDGGQPGQPAWAPGETPQAMREARARGHVPIGITTDPALAAELTAAGAARVLASIEQVGRILA